MTSQELRELRKAHGLTQKQMGEKLGYTGNYIARLERGKTEKGRAEPLPITQHFETVVFAVFRKEKRTQS